MTMTEYIQPGYHTIYPVADYLQAVCNDDSDDGKLRWVPFMKCPMAAYAWPGACNNCQCTNL